MEDILDIRSVVLLQGSKVLGSRVSDVDATKISLVGRFNIAIPAYVNIQPLNL